MKRARILICFLAAAILLNGCFLRRKNKCMDCPKWGMQHEVPVENGKVRS